MNTERGVLGVFDDPAAAARAVRALRAAGREDVRAATPAPFPELIAALGRPKSRIGPVTLTGAFLGTAAGFALCAGTSLAWPLVTGGKPIVSVPPFVIISFELTVLIGAAVNLTAMLTSARRGFRRRGVPYDPRFSGHHIGIFAAGGDAAAAEGLLRANGALEVRRVG